MKIIKGDLTIEYSITELLDALECYLYERDHIGSNESIMSARLDGAEMSQTFETLSLSIGKRK